MRHKKRKLLMVMLLSMIMILSFFSTTKDSADIARADDTEVTPLFKPSPDPVKILFVYWTSGFTLQPTSQYTYVGQPVTLNTDTVITLLDSVTGLYRYKYQWYDSADGLNWGETNSATKKDVTIDPTEVGTVYYQQTYTRNVILGNRSGYYSKVASITTYPEPKDATAVDVTVDDDYLYNSLEEPATTYARAKPDPYDSTAKLSWSIDDTSLATIDSKTGLVTANNSGKSGVVHVTGTLTNSDDSIVEDSEKITIGGGLNDQTANEGDSATFKILGQWDEKPESIVWHKVANGKDTTISDASDLSYKTPATSMSDDGSQYYAVIKISQDDANGKPQITTITTNKAKLTVIPSTLPKISFKSNIYNLTNDDHNSDDTGVHGVIDQDEIVIKGSVKDENQYSEMTDGLIKVKLPANMTPTTVLLDGQAYDDYSLVADPTDANVRDLRIHNIDFSQNRSHDFEIQVPAASNDNLQFVTTPSLDWQKSNAKDTDGTYSGNPLSIDFSDDKLTAQANDISYGTLKFQDAGKDINGNVNGTNNTDKNLLSVQDNRRNKVATQIYLSQKNPFKDGETTLPAELRYYYQGQYRLLNENDTLISSSSSGAKLDSVGNDLDQGLRLYVNPGNFRPGSYSSDLVWTITDAPET